MLRNWIHLKQQSHQIEKQSREIQIFKIFKLNVLRKNLKHRHLDFGQILSKPVLCNNHSMTGAKW
jgi:hypothetical protein